MDLREENTALSVFKETRMRNISRLAVMKEENNTCISSSPLDGPSRVCHEPAE